MLILPANEEQNSQIGRKNSTPGNTGFAVIWKRENRPRSYRHCWKQHPLARKHTNIWERSEDFKNT